MEWKNNFKCHCGNIREVKDARTCVVCGMMLCGECGKYCTAHTREDVDAQEFWNSRSGEQKIQLMKDASGLSNPTAVSGFKRIPEAVRMNIGAFPGIMGEPEEKLVIFARGDDTRLTTTNLYSDRIIREICNDHNWLIESVMEFTGFVWVSIL